MSDPTHSQTDIPATHADHALQKNEAENAEAVQHKQPETDAPGTGLVTPGQGGQMPVICLVGPTGAGKTAASLHLARIFGGGVVNLDSRQVYKDFPIITAQPSAEEQAACPHRMYGFLPTEVKMSAGRFLDMATQAIEETRKHGLIPLLVGGTGLYLKALLDGLADIPSVDPAIHRSINEAVTANGPEKMHEQLQTIDPAYAAKIHPHDRQRIARALEVHAGTGKTLSWWHAQPVAPSPYRGIKLGIDTTLAELTPRLAERIDLMLAAGAVEEAGAARAVCEDRMAPGWSGIGCAELYSYLAGELDMDACRALWHKNTRAYAKRQLTWFRGDQTIHWVKGDDFDTMEQLVRTFLAADKCDVAETS